MIKSLVLGLALFLLIAGVKCDFKDEMKKIDEACRAVSHVNEDDIKTFIKGEMKDEPTEAFKCHMKCVMEKQGHWSADGFDSATALKHLQEMPHLKNEQKKIAVVMAGCKDKKGTNECDTAYLITKCFFEHHANQ